MGTETDPVNCAKQQGSDEGRVLVVGNLLDMLCDRDRTQLFAAGRLRVVEAGETVARQGSIGDSLFVVADGELAVVRCLPGDEENILFTAKPGLMLGELAVLDRGARSASLRATCRSAVREIGLGAFEAVTLHGGETGYRILRAVAASVHERMRTMRRIAAAGLGSNSVRVPVVGSLEWSAPATGVVDVLGVLPAFTGLDASDWNAMLPRMSVASLDRGANLVLPEASNPGIVIVLRGALSPWLDDASGPEATMPAIGPGGFVDYAAALDFASERRCWRARSPTQLLRLDPECLEQRASSSARLLYALSRSLATTLRRSTGLSMHFRMAWVRPASTSRRKAERRERTPAEEIADGTPV